MKLHGLGGEEQLDGLSVPDRRRFRKPRWCWVLHNCEGTKLETAAHEPQSGNHQLVGDVNLQGLRLREGWQASWVAAAAQRWRPWVGVVARH